MKKSVLISAIAVSLLIGNFLTGCQKATKEKEEKAAQARLEEVSMDQRQAEQDADIKANQIASADDWVDFNTESEELIVKYELQLSDLKVQAKKTGKTIDDQFLIKIGQLEMKLTELKTRIRNFDKNQSGFEKFSKDFNLEMVDLGKALNDLRHEKGKESAVLIQNN